MRAAVKREARIRRHRRVRKHVHGTSARPRLAVYRSNKHISAQVIDDERGHTLAAVSHTEAELKDLKPLEQASKAGQLLAERAKAAGVERAVFDRGGYQYHGRIKAFAEGVREGGLAV